MRAGFTLIEMAIVLVIIGLIVGGVLVGQDLIHAAGVRATISQIEKYNTATNTFREKYGYLPGDINAQAAAQFGFAARGQYDGEGDGNGFIEGVHADGSGDNGPYQQMGESCMFWVDLSTAALIDGTFTNCFSNVQHAPTYSLPNINLYLPPAKINGGNYVYVWSFNNSALQGQGHNWFGLSAGLPGGTGSAVGLRVADAYAIDQKIDDGLPQAGNVTAMYLQNNATPLYSGVAYGNVNTGATPGSSTTCFDNSSAASGTPGVAGAAQHYSLEISGGAGVNCALSFKMQAGD